MFSYLESVRLLNEMRDQGFNMTSVATFNMTSVATRLRGLRDEMRATTVEQRVIDLTQVDNFPLLTMMDLVEEQVRRQDQANAIQLIEENGQREEKGELIRYKVLSKQKLSALCDNDCVICQDKYTVKDMVITDCCRNFYCKPCLTQWTSSHNSCPTCRKERPTTMGFRQKAAPTPRL